MSDRSVPAPPSSTGWSSLALHLGVVLTIALIVYLGLRHVEPPPAPNGDVPLAEFSAPRAMQHLIDIARVPHPIGTEAHAEVRELLQTRIRALGYTPELQSGQVVRPSKNAMAQVHNVLVRVPGARPGKAVLLVAHYDSVPGSPGAADNGASVAAILETLRAIKHGPPLQNDVIALFTDGEEVGLLGAQHFVDQHPWAADVGVALNFEYRGNSGPVWMFETSAKNGRLVREWQAAVPQAFGSSLLYEVYRRMPNDTDLSVFKPLYPSLNFAAGEHYNVYHTRLDDAQSLSQATFQQQGTMMTALARHFGAIPLNDLADDDSVYFDVPGGGVVVYSHSVAIVLTVFCWLLFVAVVVLARRAGQARLPGVVKGMFAVLGVSVLLALVCQLIWLLLRQIHPEYQLQLHGSTYNDSWYLAAFGVFSVVTFVMLMRWLQKWFAPTVLMLGALLLNMVILSAVSVLAPGASYIFTWPVLPILLALAALNGVPRLSASEPLRVLLLLLAAVPALLLFAPLIHLLFIALTPLVLAATILVACVLYCVISPTLLLLSHHRVVPRAAFISTLVLFAGGSWTAGFDEKSPRPDHLMYVQLGAAGPAYVVSDDPALDAWTSQFFAKPPKKQTLTDAFGPKAEPVWAEGTAVQFNQAPQVEVQADRIDGAQRHVQLTVRSGRGAPRLLIQVDQVPVLRALVQGQAYTGNETSGWRLDAYAMNDEPVRIDLTVKAGTPFSVRVRDISYGLPAVASARPPQMMSQPFRHSDTAQVALVTRFP